MTRARRLAALVAAGVVGLACWLPTLPVASAQVSGWSVEWDDPVVSAPSADGTVVVSGTIDHPPVGSMSRVEVVLTRVGGDERCAREVTGEQAPRDDNDVGEGETTTIPSPTTETSDPRDPPEESSTFDFDVPLSFAAADVCNGRYTIEVIGYLDGPTNAGSDWRSDDDEGPALGYDGTVAVDVAPPDVRGVLSHFNADEQKVAVAWYPPPGYGDTNFCSGTPATDHPDFDGYLVERSVGGAAFGPMANGTVPPGTQCFFDQLPAGAPHGEYRYRVRAARIGTAGRVLAAGGTSSIVTVTVGPPPPPTTPPTSEEPRPPTTARAAAPVAPAVVPPPAPDDGTYDETIDYPEVGEDAAVIPEDADTFLDFVPGPGQGILVPFAVAECLAVWAFHLRYLARRADNGF